MQRYTQFESFNLPAALQRLFLPTDLSAPSASTARIDRFRSGIGAFIARTQADLIRMRQRKDSTDTVYVAGPEREAAVPRCVCTAGPPLHWCQDSAVGNNTFSCPDRRKVGPWLTLRSNMLSVRTCHRSQRLTFALSWPVTMVLLAPHAQSNPAVLCFCRAGL